MQQNPPLCLGAAYRLPSSCPTRQPASLLTSTSHNHQQHTQPSATPFNKHNSSNRNQLGLSKASNTDLQVGMEAGSAPPQWLPKGLKKSNSNASAASTKSYSSVRAIGAFPPGSLRLVNHTQDGDADVPEEIKEDEEDGPPRLEPPVEGDDAQPQNGSRESISSTSSNGRRLSHALGGGDVVLILDLPEVYMVGYDSVSFTVKDFVGVRDIPPGPHFFWVAHPGGLSTRCGVWINTAADVDTVHVIQWDRFHEVLAEASRAEARIQRQNLGDVYDKLLPYADPAAATQTTGVDNTVSPSENLRMWQQLTGSISEGVLGRIVGQRQWIVNTSDRVQGSLKMSAEVELDRRISASLLPTNELNFTLSQLNRTFTTSHHGAQRTLEARDSTLYLESLLQSNDGLEPGDLVGEVQFAYITGMLLGNEACIQQWWHAVLKIVLRAYTLPIRNPPLAAAFTRALTAHLRHSISWVDNSILDYSESQTRDLRLALTIYKSRLDETLETHTAPEHLDVGTAFAGLEAVAAELDWELRGGYLRKGIVVMEDGEQVEMELGDLEEEDERGEFAPAIVELDEDGRQRDLVSWP